MYNFFLLITTILLSFVTAKAQLNIDFVGQLPYNASRGSVSDIWGYVDTTGKEYAIVGLEKGTSIVDISNPSIPVEIFYTSGATTIWRDIKVWDKHAYIVNEGSNGLKIIDMSSFPGMISSSDVYQYTGSTYNFSKAHDIYIDENGYAYILGADNGKGGAIILDLNTDPKNPIEVGRYDDYYIHDAMVRGDTMWAGCLEHGFAVIDVSDKANPITMALHPTPNLVAHNCWVSGDGQTVFTTDEESGAYLTSFDVTDLSNIQELDRIQSNPGSGVTPHNTFVRGDYLITSYYTDGVTIHDVSDPNIMVEVGNYDTSPQFSGNGYNGCWGVYPYLPSGLIIASDIENGLYILNPMYNPASFLRGNVTDSNTTATIDGVQIDIVSTSTSVNTNIVGDYQTGIATAGTYNVTYSKLGYRTKTIENVVLTSGNTTIIDVELFPYISSTFQEVDIEEIGVYPNPFNDEINIQFNDTQQDVTIEVYSITGKMIESKSFGSTLKVKLVNDYKPGIYFVKVVSSERVLKTTSLIKL